MKEPEQIDRAKILRLAELVREHAEQSYNAERPLQFSEMALISRSCDEIGREISKPERRHGRWIPTEYDSYADGNPVYDAFECSECGHEHSGEEDTLTAFCPDCGARMDGGSDGGKV